jgi:hypothetical protein
MIRFGAIACTAFLVAAVNQALAQARMEQLPGPPPPASAATPATGGIAPSVYASANVGQFLAVCGSDQGGCADEIGNALIERMMYDGTANICLPGPDYAGSVLDYLKAHPETGSMPTEDGIYLAIRKVYSCG